MRAVSILGPWNLTERSNCSADFFAAALAPASAPVPVAFGEFEVTRLLVSRCDGVRWHIGIEISSRSNAMFFSLTVPVSAPAPVTPGPVTPAPGKESSPCQ